MKPVNLNKVRKNKARTAAKAKADENAFRFGRSKAQKSVEHAREAKIRFDLDQHKRDDT